MPTPHEIASFRLFLKKGLIFAAPFVLYACLMVAIDPFDYFRVSRLVDSELKRKVSMKIDYALWQTLAFEADPKPNVMFGDSRMALFKPASAERVTGEPWFNFSLGGGTIPEMVDSFWFADERVDLERVFIGLSFVNFNRFQNMNRLVENRAILEQPLLYLSNRIVAKAAFYVALSQLRGEVVAIEKPPMDREAFWRYQLGDAMAAHYDRFVYPPEHLEALREVAQHCAEQGIELTFVIVPSHVEAQEKIGEFGHSALAERFGSDLRSLGRVLDLDFSNAFTRDRANFSDPVHFHPSDMLLEQVFGDSPDPALVRR